MVKSLCKLFKNTHTYIYQQLAASLGDEIYNTKVLMNTQITEGQANIVRITNKSCCSISHSNKPETRSCKEDNVSKMEALGKDLTNRHGKNICNKTQSLLKPIWCSNSMANFYRCICKAHFITATDHHKEWYIAVLGDVMDLCRAG